MKGWNKIYWASTKKRKTGVSILIPDKVKAKVDLTKTDREGNIPLSDLDKSNKKNKKDVREVNEILEKIELINIWKIVNRDKKKYTFFSAAHDTFTKIDHVLGHRNMAKKTRKSINNQCNLFRS